MKFTDCIDIVGKKVKNFDGKKLYVSTGALDKDHINSSAVEIVTYLNKPSRADLSVEEGDVLFAKMAGTQKTLVVNSITSANIYSTGFFAVRAKKNVLNSKCLYYILNSRDFLFQKDKHSSGATQKAINNKGLEKIEVTFPPYDEQNSVVEELDKLSLIIDFRKQQIEQLDLLIKARFVEMFGEPVFNSLGWPIYQLSEYIEFLTSGSRGWAQYFTDDGNYFITIKNVKNCRVTLDDVQHIVPPNNAEAKRTKVQEGDLLISITADLGRTGVVTKEIAEHGGYINQHLTCIRLDRNKLNPLYVAYYMESEAGKTQFQLKNQNAVKAGLNFNSISSLRLMVPPLNLQNDFVSFVTQVDKSKVAVQKALDEAQLLFDSLMQEYFG